MTLEDQQVNGLYQEILAQTANYIEDKGSKYSGSVLEWNEETRQQFRDVSIEKLICDSYFLGMKDAVYPSVINDICELWEERKQRTINLAIFVEGIGSGKTVKASIILWLQWFEMCLLGDPQAYYHLAPNSVIAFIAMSRTEVQAKRVAFSEIWRRFISPFNKDYFPPHPRYSAEIQIARNNTVIFPGTSSALSALGYNLYGGIVDEANFLEVIEGGRKSQGDTYDAAEEMHNAITARMTSRFMMKGNVPGILVMFSSPRYTDDFLERKIRECEELMEEDSKVFWRKRPLWEAKGAKFFPPERGWFYIDTEKLAEIPMESAEKYFKLKDMLNLASEGHIAKDSDRCGNDRIQSEERQDHGDSDNSVSGLEGPGDFSLADQSTEANPKAYTEIKWSDEPNG